jgi:hypothetical protein
MPPVLTPDSALNCPHGGKATHAPGPSRVKVGGLPALLQSDTGTVAGCAFTIPTGKPSPCTTVHWTVAALRVKTNGTPLLLSTSAGLCNSPEQAPQGAPIVAATQPRVRAQ